MFEYVGMRYDKIIKRRSHEAHHSEFNRRNWNQGSRGQKHRTNLNHNELLYNPYAVFQHLFIYSIYFLIIDHVLVDFLPFDVLPFEMEGRWAVSHQRPVRGAKFNSDSVTISQSRGRHSLVMIGFVAETSMSCTSQP